MIRHIVLTRFKATATEEQISDIYAGLQSLTQSMEGVINFGGGRSESPENIERGYKHGFSIDFDSWDHLETYANNEVHKALGARLVALAEGGVDGVLVLDIEFKPA